MSLVETEFSSSGTTLSASFFLDLRYFLFLEKEILLTENLVVVGIDSHRFESIHGVGHRSHTLIRRSHDFATCN